MGSQRTIFGAQNSGQVDHGSHTVPERLAQIHQRACSASQVHWRAFGDEYRQILGQNNCYTYAECSLYNFAQFAIKLA